MFKYKLKKLLETKHIDEAEFCSKLNIDDKTLEGWLTGDVNPTLEDINKINIVFDLEATYFVAEGKAIKKAKNNDNFILILSLLFLVPAIILMFFVPTDDYSDKAIIIKFLFADWIEEVTMWRLLLFIPGISLLTTFIVLKVVKCVKRRKNKKNKNV